MLRVAVTGAGGQLGRPLVTAFAHEGHETRGFSRVDLDISDAQGHSVLRSWAPDVVVNAAAWTDVDGCARDPDRAMRINGDAAGMVAATAAASGALIIQISTNEVFDGTADRPYTEDDEPHPINAYGASKLVGEQVVAGANSRHVIVRTAWLFGPGGVNFVTKILRAASALSAGEGLRVVDDERGNPTWAPDLASVIVALAGSVPPSRIVHAVGTPPTSRLGWARIALHAADMNVRLVPVPLRSFARASTPPQHAVLQPSAGLAPLDWRLPTRSYAAGLAQRHAAAGDRLGRGAARGSTRSGQ